MLPLAIVLILALDCIASPLISQKSSVSLSLARHVNITGSVGAPENDRARARAFVARAADESTEDCHGVFPVSLTNTFTLYLAPVSNTHLYVFMSY